MADINHHRSEKKSAEDFSRTKVIRKAAAQRGDAHVPLSQDNSRRLNADRDTVSAYSRKTIEAKGSAGESDYSRNAASRRYSSKGRHASHGSAYDMQGVKRFRRPALFTLIGLFVVCLVACAVWYIGVSNSMKPSEDVSSSVSTPGFNEPYYILLLGSDSRSEKTDVARADTIMLCRVDESKKQVALISMPRDLKIEIEGHGTCKLNSALTYGGVSGAIDAVSKVAGVPISYYATIYFSGFENLVDELGGVTVKVPPNTHYNGVFLDEGTQTLNGKQALTLARVRKTYATGDFQRTTNQRNLMKAIAKKTLQQPFYRIPGLVGSMAGNIETNIPTWKLGALVLSMKGMDSDDMYSASVPSSSQMIGGVSYVVADEDAWAAMMARVNAGQDPNA